MTQFADLSSASVGQEELNPLAFDYADYADKEDMLAFILNNDERVKIDTKALSVNGTVIQDPMPNYLGTKAISNSAIKEALKSPLHYYVYANDETPKPAKKHFELGTFIHQAFLEPELFDLNVEAPQAALNTLQGCQTMIDFWEAHANVLERGDARTAVKELGLDIEKADGKREYIKQLESRSKYTAISAEHAQIIKLVKRHYHTYGGGIIPKLLKGALTEVSMYGNDPETGLKVKIRPDAIQTEENIGVNAIISFKSTKAQTKGKFELDCANYGFHLGEGMYQKVASHITGRKFNATIMIAIQTTAPYLPMVLWWSPEDLHMGKLRYDHGMQTIKDAMEKGIYPGFDAYAEYGHCGIIDMKLPSWIERDVDPVDLEE